MDEYNEELHHEEQAGPEREVNDENSFSTLGFPIGDIPRGVAPMKKIPLSALPNFHGLSSEDPDEFLFEFDILCRRKCTKMVHESWRPCNHNMGSNETEIPA
jgi:hypothetical protein